jgi:uncharacterized protein with WD repeat
MKNDERKTGIAVGINYKVGSETLLFIDYDAISEKDAIDDATEIMNVGKLSAFELFKTRNGYHAIFWWDAMSDAKRLELLYASKADENFKARKGDTIRIAGKYKKNDIVSVGVYAAKDELSKAGWAQRKLANKIVDAMPELPVMKLLA